RQAAGDGEALQRFQREAKIVSSLRHPHIVHVIDFDQTSDGRPYLVMELLEGEDLHAHLRRVGPLPLPRVVAIVKQIASALAAAHGRGVVHRDLKPENVLLANIEGQDGDYVKIVDFGVSKVKSASLRLTKGGAMMGTPHYMAPEQAQGSSDVDEKVDQFALAAIAYELLSGEVAFAGDDVASVVYQVVFGEPPRLVDADGLVSAPVDAAIKKALSKAATDRFGSVAEFAKAFEKAARGTRGSGWGAGDSRPALRPVSDVARPAAVTVAAPGNAAASGRAGKIVAVLVLTAAAAGILWITVLRDDPSKPMSTPATAPATAPVAPMAAPTETPRPRPASEPALPPAAAENPAPVAVPEIRPPPAKPARHPRQAPRAEERLYNDL
ncbi:MAG TPA: serine/threonine-protein kinase, partial [Polyangia bacterium]|nr:serine/threonine-protein kinase [Polyangia bacterium]